VGARSPTPCPVPRNTRDPFARLRWPSGGGIRDGRLRKSPRACLSRSFVTVSGPVAAPLTGDSRRRGLPGSEMRSQGLLLTRRRVRRGIADRGKGRGRGGGNDAAETQPRCFGRAIGTEAREKLTIALMDDDEDDDDDDDDASRVSSAISRYSSNVNRR